MARPRGYTTWSKGARRISDISKNKVKNAAHTAGLREIVRQETDGLRRRSATDMLLIQNTL